jgi:hypothetical protein
MSPTYRDTGAGDAGLSFNLDNAPHAAVHIDVGNRSRGMATIAWAANDPIFWLHHSSIDRIWASWNRAGGRNPDEAGFLAETFGFIDETGQPTRTACIEAMDTALLGYVYDRYLDRPAGSLPFAGGARSRFSEHAALRGADPPLRLAETLSASLAAAPGAADFAAALRDAAERNRAFVLRVGGVRIVRQPHVAYRILSRARAGHGEPPRRSGLCRLDQRIRGGAARRAAGGHLGRLPARLQLCRHRAHPAAAAAGPPGRTAASGRGADRHPGRRRDPDGRRDRPAVVIADPR